jgi:hypothetical protein
MHACTLAGQMMDFLLQVRVLLFLVVQIICTSRTCVVALRLGTRARRAEHPMQCPSVCLPACLPACLSACLSALLHLPACLPVFLPACLSV